MSSGLESKTIDVHPIMIIENDGKSYLQMNFSPRYLIESIVVKSIPAAVIVERSTSGQNGSATTFKIELITKKHRPSKYLKLQYALSLHFYAISEL